MELRYKYPVDTGLSLPPETKNYITFVTYYEKNNYDNNHNNVVHQHRRCTSHQLCGCQCVLQYNIPNELN